MSDPSPPAGENPDIRTETLTPEEAVDLAVALQRDGRFAEAKYIYEQVLRIRPDYPEALHYFGVLAFQLSQHETAIELIRKAVSLRPDYGPAINNLGNVLKEEHQEEEAIECYRRVLEIAPNDAGIMSNLGAALRSLGKHEEAAEILRRACAVDPQCVAAFINLGNTCRLQLKLEEAEEAYRRALELDKENISALVYLADVLGRRDCETEAVELLNRAAALNTGQANVYCLIGHGLQARSLFKESVGAYEKALQLDAKSKEAYEFAVRALCRSGNNTAAAEMLHRWLAAEPGSVVAQHMLRGVTGEDVPSRASDDYIRAGFKTFANNFDHILACLQYRAPQLVAAALARHAPGDGLCIVDAGCGTGLCGPLLREKASLLVGVDLSPEMLRRAEQRELYDELITAELTAWFQSQAADSFDAVISADTLVYFGELLEVLAGMAKSLKPKGVLVFTVERHDVPEATYNLQFHGRYRHSEAYIRETVSRAGFEILEIEHADLRREGADIVGGLVVSAKAPS